MILFASYEVGTKWLPMELLHVVHSITNSVYRFIFNSFFLFWHLFLFHSIVKHYFL